MREILFRGKRKTDNKWLYGFPYVTRKNAVKINWYCSEFGSMKTDEVDPDTVGQYTGLTDRNGKRIFEGDVVKMRAYGGGYHCTSVYFRDGKFVVDETQYHCKDICSNSVEVIGNIYDNPELMEVKQNG